MAENTAIEWADHTFNPWVGCTKVSPGCDHCYAESWAKRAGKAAGVTWGGERRRTSEDNWDKPLRWNAQAEREGRRFRVFCASLADVFDNQVPPEWREDLFELIRKTPHLDWLLLTKRIGNAVPMVRSHGAMAGNGTRYLPDNVWLGATIVDQAEADRDVLKLLRTRAELGARVLFLSIEPMLGPIDLTRILLHSGPIELAETAPPEWQNVKTINVVQNALKPGKRSGSRIDWVICGGEGGPGARPMHPDWARSLRDQCAAAGVPFLFKQWGEFYPDPDDDRGVRPVGLTRAGQVLTNNAAFNAHAGDAELMFRVGKKAAGRLLDGRTHDEFPMAQAIDFRSAP